MANVWGVKGWYISTIMLQKHIGATLIIVNIHTLHICMVKFLSLGMVKGSDEDVRMLITLP